ncbi:hypothetical protein Q7P35_008181 [Cladosporium inversicolor]
MPPKTAVGADEDVKFLLTVIKQMTSTIDWQKVSDELDLPSKGAAAKRYSRLPAKYEITMPYKTVSASPDAEDAPKTPKKGKKGAAPKKATASAKKRKVAEAEAEEEDVEDDVKAEPYD